ARELITEIVSIERRAALTTVRASIFGKVITSPKLNLLHRSVYVDAENVSDTVTSRLVLEHVAGVSPEWPHAAGRYTGNERAAKWRVDIDDAHRAAGARVRVSE